MRWPAATASASDLISRWGLEPLAGEGGHWAPIDRTEGGNGILFLMTPGEWGFSALHRLTVAESWTWLAGAPASMLLLGQGGGQSKILDAERPGTLIAPGVWMAGCTTGDWTLVACWCTPAFNDGCFTLGDRDALTKDYPDWAQRIAEFTR